MGPLRGGAESGGFRSLEVFLEEGVKTLVPSSSSLLLPVHEVGRFFMSHAPVITIQHPTEA
jgi:hypothetical protein